MTHDDGITAPNTEQDDVALSHDAIGAYILGALPDDERIVFEAHLRECPSCQQELRDLGPIAAILPRLYDDLDLPGINTPPIDLDASPDLRERIVAEAGANQGEEMVSHATIAGIEWVDPAEVAKPDTQAIESESVERVELIAEPPTIEAVDASVAATVPEIENPVVPPIAIPAVEAAVAGDEAAIAAQVAADEASKDVAATVAPVSPRRKPRGRISPGEAPPEANVVSLPKQRSSILPWAIAAAAAIVAIGSILWALAMMGQVGDLKDERNAQDQQIALLNSEREQYLADTPANVYPMLSTTTGSSDATAMVYMDPDPEGWGGIVAFRGMSQPPSGQVYQLWMIEDGQAVPGPTFMPDADGQATVQVTGDAATAQAMAITMEPDGGSETPSTTPIMQGDLTA